jgi:hypothetical protein
LEKTHNNFWPGQVVELQDAEERKMFISWRKLRHNEELCLFFFLLIVPLFRHHDKAR